MRKFVSESEQQLVQAERALLLALRDVQVRLEAPVADIGMLDTALRQIDELFLLVVVGEFNSGKSAFINALLGERLLPEGVTPTTAQIHILKYGPEAGRTQGGDALIVRVPIEWMQEVNLVDTPGTNAVIQRHQEITEDFVPRADLVLFVTSADRPFSESERAFLTRIRQWGKKIVFVLNKVDLFSNDDELAQVMAFVEQNSRQLLGIEPQIYPVSARAGLRAKQAAAPEARARLAAASGMAPLEEFILTTLDSAERMRLKLASPLGVAMQLSSRARAILEQQEKLLREDVAIVRAIESDLAAHEVEMREDFKYRLSHVDNVLYALAERGDRFFDETIRLTRVLDLVRPERVQALFQQEVVADTAARIDAYTQELIDWMVSEDLQQWQAITHALNQRIVRRKQDRATDDAGLGQAPEALLETKFAYNRRELLESVGRTAQEIARRYDPKAEAAALAESLQRTVAQAAIVEISAVGLGALLVKLLAASLADVTGILAAGALAALGLYVIPFKRNQAKRQLESRINELRQQLSAALTTQFDREMERSLARVHNAIRPYTRFVETHRAELAALGEQLDAVDKQAREMERRIADEIA